VYQPLVLVTLRNETTFQLGRQDVREIRTDHLSVISSIEERVEMSCTGGLKSFPCVCWCNLEFCRHSAADVINSSGMHG